MMTPTTLRRAVPIILSGLTTLALNAQHIATLAPDPRQSSNDRSEQFITIEVPPGFSFISTVYSWVDLPAGSGTVLQTAAYDFLDGVPVDWIDGSQGFTPTGGESLDCGTPYPITVPITAPSVPGTYTATLVDVNGFADMITYELLVVETPSYIDFLQQDTLFVDELENVIGVASGAPLDVACVFGLSPGNEIQYDYTFYPPVPWISQTPMHVTVPAGVDSSVTLMVQSAVPGDFVTYRYRSQSWYTNPQIVEYDLHVELSTGMPHGALLPGQENMLFYPNPADQLSNIRITMGTSASGYLMITDATGREVMRETCVLRTGENALALRTAHLPAGIYGCSLVIPGVGSTVARRLQVVH